MGAEAHREAERSTRMGRRTCRAVQRTASHPSGAEILTRGFPRIHHCITAVLFCFFSTPGSGLTTIVYDMYSRGTTFFFHGSLVLQ